ncbi:MAG: hypothetical protein H7A37_04200 [Chlamydiales bacterium]|nr:hypothetical protein [Chlamydiia bacterium]MCP5507488.1 hypothetical protein [Chlamydiales bacterium]
MLKNIPRTRLLLYLMVIGLLPLIFVLAGIYGKKQELAQLDESIQHVQQMALTFKKRQAQNIAVRNHFRDADHFYIDKYLETLTFLEPEIEALQKIVNNKNFAGDPVIKKRLEQLTGETNSLSFTEGAVQSYPHYQETTETLVRPVEVNIEDVQKVLSRVEGKEIDGNRPGPNRPQLLVLDFKLDKKRHADNNEVYVMNMKLLKREYL